MFISKMSVIFDRFIANIQLYILISDRDSKYPSSYKAINNQSYAICCNILPRIISLKKYQILRVSCYQLRSEF